MAVASRESLVELEIAAVRATTMLPRVSQAVYSKIPGREFRIRARILDAPEIVAASARNVQNRQPLSSVSL